MEYKCFFYVKSVYFYWKDLLFMMGLRVKGIFKWGVILKVKRFFLRSFFEEELIWL